MPGEEQRESIALQIEAAIFRNARQEFATGVTREAAKVLNTSRPKFAIDVGGPNGALLHGLMAANPKLRGAVFDLPEILPAARAAATALGLARRNLTFAGNFSVSVPSSDLYFLKHVLQNWDDERCIRILKNCRRAIQPGGRVIIVEIVSDVIDASGPTSLLDLDMLVLSSGRDRTIGQYEAVLNQAGLSLDKVIRTRTSATVLEATVPQRAAAVRRRKPPSSQATAAASGILRRELGGR